MLYDVYLDEDIRIKMEVDEFLQVCLHMEVLHWSRSVLKKSKRLAEYLKEALYLEGFETAYTVTPNPKFVRLVFGGSVFDKVIVDDINYEVVVWDLR